ncbi:MAG: hypothetical protein KGS47_13800 [Chloroflexi bacterium]|nr:hypothetical protein [Chloroflexota bacterium]
MTHDARRHDTPRRWHMAWLLLLALGLLVPLAATPSHAVAPRSAPVSAIAPMSGISQIEAADHTCVITAGGGMMEVSWVMARRSSGTSRGSSVVSAAARTRLQRG